MFKNKLISVCGPKDREESYLKLSTTSRAPVENPSGWKELWKLSPFSSIENGIEIPGLKGVYSKTVENAWQFLKVWEGEGEWNRDEAMAAFNSDCAIRFPRGRKPKVKGHFWAKTGEIIDYISARVKIYFPLYLKMLELPDRQVLLQKLKEEASINRMNVWDYDSYSIEKEGLKSIFETIFYTKKPFAHSFIVAIAIDEKISEFIDYINKSNWHIGKIMKNKFILSQ